MIKSSLSTKNVKRNTYINVNSELLFKLVASKLKMWAEAHP